MSLIATSVGLELNPETNEHEFVIRLVAQTKEDVPDLNMDDVWGETPLRLSRTIQKPLTEGAIRISAIQECIRALEYGDWNANDPCDELRILMLKTSGDRTV